jgi:two-component system chemotaxis sensor kinase CheA
MNTGELLAMFRDEAQERIDRMVDTLLALERGSPPADAVAELFRDAHSIKGGAGMMGLDAVYEIANALEDRLAEARDRGDLDLSLVEPLLGEVDGLRAAVAAATGATADVVAQAEAEHSAPPASVTVPADEPPAPAPAPRDGDQRSIRIDAAKVDRLLDAVGETVLQHRRLEHALESTDAASNTMLDRGDVLLGDLQDAVIQLRTLPLSAITGPFPRALRDLASAEGKQVELVIEGADTQLDRAILEGASETIGHLLRNAVGHGVEHPDERRRAGKPATARVTLRAEQRGGQVAIDVADDGRGVAPELLERARGDGRSLVDVLAEPGMSTAHTVTELSGRGVGLDAVRSAVEAVGGDLEVASEPGRGTTVTMLLPVSLVLLHVLLVERARVPLGIPLSAVAEVVAVQEPMSLRGRRSIDVRGESVALVDPVAALGESAGSAGQRLHAVVIAAGGRRVALACDRVTAEEEVLVKPLGPLLAGVPGYLGAAIMRDGRIALVADPAHLASVPSQAATERTAERAAGPEDAATVLVVDDQFTVRELQRSILEASGYRVRVARDGREAWDLLSAGEDVDVVVTDIEPEMDGLQLLESIRRLPERGSLPVVVVTSRAREEDERRGLEAGADAYIVKERFDQRVLLDTVARLVSP